MKPCNQCGKCCLQYSDGGLSVTAEEIDWWEMHRPEIFKFVDKGEIWVDPETGARLTICPWLQQEPKADTTSRALYSCAIYHDRPDDCRHYPVSIDEMVRDKCEMIEVKDLNNPKLAQIKLDKIMSDSRPPYKG
jgi:Fe-S-cluster containining protein